ncbi:MAG: hypothetical protein GVY14_11165, partial [Spirochaetes bacterium]|nr:hypothetical protein [Spirochaetota bacterium]
MRQRPTDAPAPVVHGLGVPALALALSLALLGAPALRAQEANAAGDSQAGSEGVESATEETLPEDIRTASFYELSLWLDRLDLSTRGARRDLEQRLFEHYGLEYSEPETGQGGREIIIESALESSYFELTEIEQRYVRLRGGVVLRMEDPEEGVIHTIAAEELVFNRETEAITARGNIEYVIDRGTSSERFTGDQLTIYLDDWEGVFLEGTSRREREIRGRDLEFRYSGAYITRSPDDIVTLEDGVITSSQGEPPYYRIRARKIWVLGPGEWGLQGASLYVGRVPLLYLPFFFRPGDRLFFNPVVGVKNREGAFVQTTTYLVGRKDPEESQVSVLQLAENAGEGVPREIDGLFLRPVQDPETGGDVAADGNTLKLLSDVYTTLGAYIGLEADYEDLGFADTLQATLGLGVSKNIYNRGGLLYTDRYVEDDGSTSVSWNSTQIGDARLPFRYNLALEWGLSQGGLSVDTTLEWFSDPFVMQDYGDRAESMDWFSLIDPDQQVEESTGAEQSDLDWRAVGRYRSELPALEPYVERLDVDRLEISARWLSREIDASELSPEVLSADRSPETEFYFPENLVLPNLRITAAGTLVEGEFGPEDQSGESVESGEPPGGGDDGEDGGVAAPPELRPPWSEDGAPEDPAHGRDGEALRPPEIRGDLEGIVTRTPMSYRVGYRFRPTLRIDNEYLDSDWDTPEDIDFRYEYSTLTTDNSLTGTYLLGFYDRLFEVDGTVRTNGRYRDLYNEWDLDDPGIEQLRTDSFDYSSLTVGNDFTVRTYPAQDNAYIGDSTLSYTLNATYFRRSYDGLDRFDDPVYRNELIEWTTEDVSDHNIAGDLRVDYWNATQSLRVVGNLPPIDNRYDGTLTLITGPLTSRLQTSALRENDLWTYEPLRVTETLAFGDNVSLRERFVYDIEEDRPDSSETNLKLWWLTADFRARHAVGYEFDDMANTFEETSDEAFRPTEAVVGLDVDYETDPFWKRRVNLGFGVNSDLRMDLQRFTQSSLDFEFSFTTRVYEFLDMSISSTSSNGLMYRYVPALADKVGVEPKNGFGDLLRSFNFFNTDDRRESDFNLTRVDVDATHYLGDWVLTLRYSGVP